MPCKTCKDEARCERAGLCQDFDFAPFPRTGPRGTSSVLEQAMRLHDEAAEARRLFGRGHGHVPAAEADRSRRTRAELRAFLAVHLVDKGDANG